MQKTKREKLPKEKRNEIESILFLTAGIFILLSLLTFRSSDLPFFTSHPNVPVKNICGFLGAYTSGILFFLMGVSSYAIAILFFIWGINRLVGAEDQKMHGRLIGTIILILTISSLASMIMRGASIEEFRTGGTIGFFLSKILLRYFGPIGSYVILFSLLILSLVLATEFMVLPIFLKIHGVIAGLMGNLKERASLAPVKIKQKLKEETRKIASVKRPEPSEKLPVIKQNEKPEARAAKQPAWKETFLPKQKEVEYAIHKPEKEARQKTAAVKSSAVKAISSKDLGEYKLPALDLLDSPPPIEERKIKDDLKLNSEILESTLADFDIEAKVVRVEQGPVITRYELEPAPGVKITRITALSDNIALVMKAQSIRIVAPIPGKGTVGVEVPNSASSMVYFKEVLDSDEFRKSSSKLTMALGKDIAGRPVIADLSDMPHLLIAGTTGSGKTVCVNCLIMSFLFSMDPEEVKFVMVDPKMVELAVFNGLPHLLCPVVTDAKKAAASLNWVVNEMENRYKLLAKVGARNIGIFNEKIEKEKNKYLDESGKSIERLPFIIVIIDELADLMIVSKDVIENAITRLAQLSRAVGIHLILATQRPSVDVITGVIKANFPARISFKVASKVDSRTVLDMNGADKLLGRGDMLFIEPGAARPVRAQGGLISDSEIERIVDFVKSQRETNYDESVLAVQEKKAVGKVFEKDELFDDAVKTVLDTKQASVSILQRKLGLGYTRAARLIDAMEDEGIVGPYRGSKPREILVNGVETAEKKENE
ncbi:MAG: DNA translocase FtsK 4TM domain-containing protein [Candidatus Omnitrophica bacterium]|nr:DNA translocase FtsK 4TM domain-containing protein [Candidatus Omnitrophota bacterium]